MPVYLNLGGNSNVKSYRLTREQAAKKPSAFLGGGFSMDADAEDAIEVTFGDGRTYVYTAGSVGRANLNKMIELAEAGQGLNSFIMRNVKMGYVRKY